jgi:hypothetical protein
MERQPCKSFVYRVTVPRLSQSSLFGPHVSRRGIRQTLETGTRRPCGLQRRTQQFSTSLHAKTWDGVETEIRGCCAHSPVGCGWLFSSISL